MYCEVRVWLGLCQLDYSLSLYLYSLIYGCVYSDNDEDFYVDDNDFNYFMFLFYFFYFILLDLYISRLYSSCFNVIVRMIS